MSIANLVVLIKARDSATSEMQATAGWGVVVYNPLCNAIILINVSLAFCS